MSELVMMEAALFQIRAAVSEDPAALAARMAAGLVANAIEAAKQEGINAARVNDIEFALTDLIAAIDEGPAPDEVYVAVNMLQNDVARLRAATAIPHEIVTAIRELQARMRVRKAAIERNTFRPEGTEEAALPHPPEELRAAALPIKERLSASGFATPSLDTLIDDPSSLRFHSINEIIDELDVIAPPS